VLDESEHSSKKAFHVVGIQRRAFCEFRSSALINLHSFQPLNTTAIHSSHIHVLCAQVALASVNAREEDHDERSEKEHLRDRGSSERTNISTPREIPSSVPLQSTRDHTSEDECCPESC
jgi:hypothetical protein